MTAPHRWLRAAHLIAPNGALFADISYYRLGRTERSRPFPTNLPKVRNLPGRLTFPQGGKEGSRPLPTNDRKVRYNRENANFRQVCRGRIDASRGVCPLGRFAGMAATGGIYAAPTNQPVMFIIIYGRGRGLPRPYRGVKPSPWGEGGALARRMRGICPVVAPSSVGYADSFPQRGKP